MCFGGKDLTDLYITTAAENGPAQYAPVGFDFSAPKGGSLYRVHINIAGKDNFQTRFSMA